MNIQITHHSQLEIIKYLYQFKDDNKFYKLDENLLDIQSKKEKYMSISTLRDCALIATDSELKYTSTGNITPDYFKGAEEIKARILPKGVVAVEKLLSKHAD
jgi:hypothetical protein